MPERLDVDSALDEKLIADVLLGDEGAARTLVSRLAPVIRRIAARLASFELREELIQEVWAHLWSRNCRVLQQWDRRGPLVHYVAVVTSNLIKDRLVKCKVPTVPIEDCPDPPDPDNPELNVEVQQLRDCLEKATGQLSQMHRELIELRHTCGFKHREIAEKLGKTIGYVGATLARAERYLREELMAACADHLGSFRSIFR
jgi:RNA polymerase sigma factor (sigma-70 family)